jgi:site-specific recombinase XerD
MEEKVKNLMDIYISNKATQTQDTYKLIIEEFYENASVGLEKQTEDIWSYVFYLKNKPGMKSRNDNSKVFSARTINRNIQCLKGFYNFLLNTKKVKFNPFDDKAFRFKTKNLSQKRPTESLQFVNVKRLCNTPDRKTQIGKRDRAALTILFSTGIRRGELVALTLGDFRVTSKSTHYLNIRKGKGDKQRFATLPKWAVHPIMDLRDQRLSEGATVKDPFFVGYRYGIPGTDALKGRAIYDAFIHYRELAGLQGVYTPHSARATAITKLLYDGFTYKEVQQFSGHESVQMVEHYDKRVIGIENAVGKKISF